MSNPNTFCTAVVVNKTGAAITEVFVTHRYDNDHLDNGHWASVGPGATSDPMTVGYWTGFLRDGRDYWHVAFKDGGGNTRVCKPNFFCYLTSEDEGGVVRIELDHNEMALKPPKSSDCTVALHA